MLFDPSHSEAFWLDVTNAALGVICLVCIAAVAWALVKDLAARWHRSPADDRADAHVFDDAVLGVTMADGGQPRRHRVDRDQAVRN